MSPGFDLTVAGMFVFEKCTITKWTLLNFLFQVTYRILNVRWGSCTVTQRWDGWDGDGGGILVQTSDEANNVDFLKRQKFQNFSHVEL